MIDWWLAGCARIVLAFIAVPEETLLFEAHLVAQVAEDPIGTCACIIVRHALSYFKQVAIPALSAVRTNPVLAARGTDVMISVSVQHAGFAHKLSLHSLAKHNQDVAMIARSLIQSSAHAIC